MRTPAVLLLAVVLAALSGTAAGVLYEWTVLYNNSVPAVGRLAPGAGVTVVESSGSLVFFGGGGNTTSSVVWSVSVNGASAGPWVNRPVTFSTATLNALPSASSGHASISAGSTMVTAQANSGITVVLDLSTWVWRRGYNNPYLGNSFGFTFGDGTLAYLVGGRSELGVPVDTIFSYMPTADTGPLGSSPWTFVDRPQTASWMERRYSPGVAMCPWSNLLYIFGGKLFGVPQNPDRSLYLFNPATLNMTLLFNAASAQPEARWGAKLICAEPFLYLFGGLDDTDPGNPIYFNDVWQYSIGSGFWNEIVPATAAQPAPRVLHGCDVGPLHLYCFGGQTSSAVLNDLWAFQFTVLGPAIVSVVASDPDNLDDVYSVGDLFTITFSEATNQPPVQNITALNALFTFSSSIGPSATGSWVTASVLEIITVDITGATGNNAPAIGSFTMTVKAAGQLRNAAQTSLPSVSTSPPLTGNWGIPPGPTIIGFVASDPDNLDGILSNGDVLTLLFNGPTAQPRMTSKANIDSQFAFSDNAGTNYTGVWTDPQTLRITLLSVVGSTLTIGSTTTLCIGSLLNAAQTSRPCDTASPPLTGNWGTLPGPTVISMVAADPDNQDGVFSTGDTLTLTFNVPTSQVAVGTKAALQALFVFPLSLGADYQGLWINSTLLVITITDATGSDLALNNLDFRLTFAAGNTLQNAGQTSMFSAGPTVPVTGNWGLKAAPFIVLLQAADPDNQDAIYSTADTVSVVFSQPTNTPLVFRKADIDAVFNFSTPLGFNYTGLWLNASTAVLTITDAFPPPAPSGLAIGALTMRVLASGGLRSMPPYSVLSTAQSPPLSGNWGLLAGPAIVAFIADDPDDGDGIYSNGDTFALVFNIATNQPSVSTKAALDALLTFSVPIGAAYTGVWSSPSILNITVASITGNGGPQIGVTTVRVSGSTLYNAAITSLPSAAVSPPLTGDFGNRAGPSILSFTASDPDNQDGYYSAGDIAILVFSEPTNTPPASPRAVLDALLSFNQALGSNYDGTWLDTARLRINVINPAGATPPAIGVLVATVRGSLTNLAGTSLPSRAVSPPLAGNWGTGPSCTATDCAGCSVIPGCGWCHMTSSCQAGSAAGALYQNCPAWDFGTCTSCNSSSCTACVANPRCGFCAAPGSYNCDFGGASGPYAGSCSGIWHQTCPTAAVVPGTGAGNTTETGGTVVVALTLTAQPISDVLVSLASSNTGEGVLNVSYLVFTASNWATPMQVLLTGVDDQIDDGDVRYEMDIGPLISSDLTFQGAVGAPLVLYNVDNDLSAIVVSAASRNTSEAGQTATFSVALASQPTGTVVLTLASTAASEGVVFSPSPPTLSFSPSNWNVAVFVTVRGVDDQSDDGDVLYAITVSVSAPATADPKYRAAPPASVPLYNLNDDVAGYVLSAVSSPTYERGQTLAEFSVALRTKPLVSATTLPIVSNDTSEVIIPPFAASLLIFSDTNWATPQTVTVQGVDDSIADGNVTVRISVGPAVIGDARYRSIAGSVLVVNIDDDSIAVLTTALSGHTTEAGGTALFTVRLGSMPSQPVTMALRSNDTTEATVSPAALTFSPSNWNQAQAITVTGVDDSLSDGTQPFAIIIDSVAGDPAYAGIAVAPVIGFNDDDDIPAIVPVGGTAGGFSGPTAESGTTATAVLRLRTQPASQVTLFAVSQDTTEAAVVGGSTLIFTPATWSVPQTVTVRGVDDNLADGNQLYSVLVSSSSADPAYSGITLVLNNTNVDNDIAALVASPLSSPPFTTGEPSVAALVGVALTSMPLSAVTITIGTSDGTEGVPDVTSITIAPADWATPVPVRVVGQNDNVDDGDVAYFLVLGPTSSGDPAFVGLYLNVSMVNTDDGDTAGVVLGAVSGGGVVTETGSRVTIAVTLSAQPAGGTVTLPVTESDVSEATVTPSSLVFSTTNWAVPQTVTVTGVNDDIADGDVQSRVTVGPASAPRDPAYIGVFAIANITTLNDDVAGVALVTAPGSVTEAGPGQTNFTFALTSQPLFPVLVPITSQDTTEGMLIDPSSGAIVSSYTVLIQPFAWAVPVFVRVIGVDDSQPDGDTTFIVQLGPLASGDAGYSGLPGLSVLVVNINNDFADVGIYSEYGLLPEASAALVSPKGDTIVWMYLLSQPSAAVTVPFSLLNPGAATVLPPPTLTFTPANFAVPQAARLHPIDDVVYDGATAVPVLYGPTMSSDSAFAGKTGNLTLWTVDNDQAQILFLNTPPLVGNVTESGGSAVAVFALGARPSDSVTVPVSVFSPKNGEAAVHPTSLVFTTANWLIPQTVTVVGLDDALADGAQPVTLFLGGAVSSDLFFNARFAGPYTLYNLDNDVIGLVVTTDAPTLVVSESGAPVATVVLSLSVPPTADVVLGFAVSDPTEAALANGNSLTFTAGTWAVPRTVTVIGVQDTLVDGLVSSAFTFGALVSGDARFNGLATPSIPIVTLDDDGQWATAAIQATAPTNNGRTTEAGGQVSVLALPSVMPVVSTTLTAASTDATEGLVVAGAVSLYPGGPATWVPVLVTVRGQNDNIADGDVSYALSLALSSLGPSSGISIPLVNAEDTDLAAIVARHLSSTPSSPLQVSESGLADSFAVTLASEPTATVSIPISSRPTSGDVSFSPSTVLFSPASWAIPQVVVVTGTPDTTVDGNVAFTVVLGPAVSADAAYSGLTDASLAGINNDAVAPAVSSVSPSVLPLAGGTVTITGKGFVGGLTLAVLPLASGGTRALGDNTMAAGADDAAAGAPIAVRPRDGSSNATLVGSTLYCGTETPTSTPCVVVFSSSVVLFVAPPQREGSYRIHMVVPDGSSADYSPLVYTPNCPTAGTIGLGTACRPCPKGGYCPGGNVIIPLPGYWSPGPGSGTVYPCFPASRCLGGAGSPCAAGYGGAFCGSCVSGYAPDGFLCAACNSAPVTAFRWVVFVLFWIGFAIACAFLNSHTHAQMVWLLLVIVLVRGAGGGVTDRIHESARGFFNALGFAALDFEFIQPGCHTVIPPNFTSVFLGTVFSVAAAALLVVVVLTVLAGAGHDKVQVDFGRRLRRGLLSVMLISFWALAKVAMQGVACIERGSTHYLMAQMSARCYVGGERVVLTILAILLWVYLAVVLALVALFFHWYSGLLDRDDMSVNYGVLYELLDVGWHWFTQLHLALLAAFACGAYMLFHVAVLKFVVMEIAVLVYAGLAVHQPFSATWQSGAVFGVALAALITIVVNFMSWDSFSLSSQVMSGFSVLALLLCLLALVVYIVLLFLHARSRYRGGLWAQSNRIHFAHTHHPTGNGQVKPVSTDVVYFPGGPHIAPVAPVASAPSVAPAAGDKFLHEDDGAGDNEGFVPFEFDRPVFTPLPSRGPARPAVVAAPAPRETPREVPRPVTAPSPGDIVLAPNVYEYEYEEGSSMLSDPGDGPVDGRLALHLAATQEALERRVAASNAAATGAPRAVAATDDYGLARRRKDRPQARFE